MKKVLVLIGVLLTVSIGAVKAHTDVSKSLEFKNDQFDFGKIPYGKPAEYNILAKNTGMDSVTISNVQVGCGCTTPKYEKGKKYGPGETLIITIGFNGNSMGSFSKAATLSFNNGAFNKQVTFKGETYTAPVNH